VSASITAGSGIDSWAGQVQISPAVTNIGTASSAQVYPASTVADHIAESLRIHTTRDRIA
jgi:hypothetical protein